MLDRIDLDGAMWEFVHSKIEGVKEELTEGW